MTDQGPCQLPQQPYPPSPPSPSRTTHPLRTHDSAFPLHQPGPGSRHSSSLPRQFPQRQFPALTVPQPPLASLRIPCLSEQGQALAASSRGPRCDRLSLSPPQKTPPAVTLPPLPATRLITDPAPRSGAWQMAVDQWMLEQVVAGGRPMLRWYRWSEPTVSLGHFQASLPPEVAERFQGLAVVRRLSGGGAILHHHELTYAVALPAGHPWADEPRQLYDRVHAAIVDVLQHHELPVTPRGEAQPGLGGAFLCFSRGDSFDLVWQGHKVLGSAQRRRKGAVLQHGSLLLTRSPHAPEFPGLTDLAHPPRTWLTWPTTWKPLSQNSSPPMPRTRNHCNPKNGVRCRPCSRTAPGQPKQRTTGGESTSQPRSFRAEDTAVREASSLFLFRFDNATRTPAPKHPQARVRGSPCPTGPDRRTRQRPAGADAVYSISS